MNTINCKKCGQIMGATSEICPACGTRVHDDSQSKNSAVSDKKNATDDPQNSKIKEWYIIVGIILSILMLFGVGLCILM